MDVDYRPHQALHFRVLSDQQIVKIYEATLECLQRTGVHVLNAEARQLLAGAGARVDGVRVRIPQSIIQSGIAATPRCFNLWGRDGKRQLRVQSPQLAAGVPERIHFGPGPTCTDFVDPSTGERRRTRRGDPGMTALVCDALENIDYVMSLGLIGDVTPAMAPVYEFAEMIANTTKPVLAWAYSPKNVADIHRIAVAAAKSEEALRQRPFYAFFATFQSPLVQTDEDLANAFWAAERGIPVIFVGGCSAGATGPVTGAGSLVVSLAGALASLTITQLKVPRAAVCIGAVADAMDLRTCIPAYGSPEMSLYSTALAEIARYLHLPFMGTAGASEAKVLDLQAAIESTTQVIFSGLSGAPLVHDVGFLDCANLGSLEMLVMTDEIIAMTRRLLRGIEVNDQTLMLDLIDRVGPGGEFISRLETAQRCRAEIWVPRLMDRSAFTNWQTAGSQSMHDRIQKRLKKLLATHKPIPLSDGAAQEIKSILMAAEARV